MKLLGGVALAAIMTVSVPAYAQDAAALAKLQAKLRAAEQWISVQLEQEAVPGASFAIVHDQKIIWSKGFGYANLEQQIPATAQTRYSICSISKLFTSLGTMQLRDEGRLNLDAPISDYINWYGIKDVEKPDGAVTARAILSHVAGLPREFDAPYWSTAQFPDYETIKARFATQTSLYRTWDYHQYSNLGMTLLGEAITTTSGRGYHDYVKTRLIDPIGLTETTSELPEQLYGSQFAIGYKSRNGRGVREKFPFYTVNALAPAAGFASSAEDLGRFASWHFRVLDGKDRLIKSETMREMQRVHWMAPDRTDETWGLGYAVFQHKGRSFVGHGGYCPGYRSILMMRPQDKTAFIALTNVNDVSPEAMARTLYDMTAADIRATYATNGAGSANKPANKAHNLSRFEGRYGRAGFDLDVYIFPYGDELLSIGLYPENPGEPTRYRHVEGNVFQRVRPDETLAETIRFELDKDGKARRYWIHSNIMDRVDD